MDYAFNYYKNEFAKHSNLAEEYITKAYHTDSPFAKAISLIWADKERTEELKALIKLNEIMGNVEDNDYWQQKINKILSKYPTKKEVLFYES